MTDGHEVLYLMRGAERIVIQLGAIACVVLGVLLYRWGIQGKTTVGGQGAGFQFEVKNAAPGTVLALFGITVMIVGILNPLKVIEPKADAERSSDATGGGGAPSSDPVSPPEASGGSTTGTAGVPAQSAGTPGKAEPPPPPVHPGVTVVYTSKDTPAGLLLLELRQVRTSSLSPEKSKAVLADFAGRARGMRDANPAAAAVLSELSRSGTVPLEQAQEKLTALLDQAKSVPIK